MAGEVTTEEWAALSPRQQAAVKDAIWNMEFHQKAHWQAEPLPDGTKDCPHCGLTWLRMYGAAFQGAYICSLGGWVA